MSINSINNNYNTNFKSRNAEIRFADNIARKVNQEFPCISSSKMLGFKNKNQYWDKLCKIDIKIEKMKTEACKAYGNAWTFSQKLLALTSLIKKRKLGNCGELAMLAEIAARVNGINDCCCVSVMEKFGKRGEHKLNHAVLMVKNNGKPYIIDPWLGFADYIPETIKRYQKDFRMYFDLGDGIKNKIFFEKPVSFNPTGEIFAKKYSVEKLRKLYSELILNKTVSEKLTLWQRFKLLFNYSE